MADGGVVVLLDGGPPDAAPADGPAPDVAPPADAPPPPKDLGADAAPACQVNRPCKLADNGDGLCKNGVCVACNENAADDNTCNNTYQGNRLCVGGKCTVGECRTSAQCQRQQICGSNHNCAPCNSDLQCRNDAVYGTTTICLNPGPGGRCVKGDCHDSRDCGARICNQMNHTCVACTADAQCAADPNHPNTICKTTAGADQGSCVAKTCTPDNQMCANNAGDFCCGGSCVPGNCCTNDQCSDPTPICTNNRCAAAMCQEVGNDHQFVVDPVNGSDGDASTGSGKATGGGNSAACRFKTLTRALARVGLTPPAGTTITIIGGANVALTGEMFPFQVGANTRITTAEGAVTVRLTPNAIGFRMIGNNANLTPADNGVLTIDGNGNSGQAVAFNLPANATGTIRNVAVTKTGEDGIQVTAGTINIERNVTVSGTVANGSNGLDVSDGTVNINNMDMAAPVVMSGNRGRGIDVAGTAVLNITAVHPGDADVTPVGSVVLKDNVSGNLRFKQTPGGQDTVSNIVQLVVVGTPGNASGVEIGGGSNVKIRNTVIVKSGGRGVNITEGGDGAGKAVGNIDLGKGDFGNNALQVAGANANGTVGLCLDIAAPTGVLSMIGNKFTAADCRLVNQMLTLRADCNTAHTDIGAQLATGVASFDVSQCALAK